MNATKAPFMHSSGFTLIEIMIVAAIVAILSSIAIPSYSDYVTRSKIPEATSALAAKRVQMEQYFQDNHTYASAPACNSDTSTSKYFTFSCTSEPTATAFELRAVGTSSMSGFTYTVDQSNNKKTTAVPSGWTTSDSCWVTQKGGSC